jgi:histidine triad (HIT) family protein
MEKSIFEKIVDREIAAFIVAENNEFLAFLDAFPASYAQTLVIPKQQRDSYVFRHEQEFMNKYWSFIKDTALLLDTKLKALRTVIMFEGFEVNHLHAKLYPMLTMQQAEVFNPRVKSKLTAKEGSEIIELLKP